MSAADGLSPQPGTPGTYRHGAQPCRSCAAPLDAITAARGGDARPEHGDVTICWRCGEVSMIDIGPFGIVYREPTLDELAEVARRFDDVIRHRQNAHRFT